MTEIIIGTGSALWLGILTSISPCPLAANVAAVSFISKKIIHPKAVFVSGVAYTFGRMISYAVLGIIIVNSLLSVPTLANFLQKYMNKVMGPLLIATGLILLDVIKFNMPGIRISEKNQARLAGSGAAGAFVLGLIFALVFCPVSAALFFGSLIPLAGKNNGGYLLPLVYGIGTGLPVLVFAIAIALGVTSLSSLFNKIARVEFYTRRITGCIFILAGLYYLKIYVLHL